MTAVLETQGLEKTFQRGSVQAKALRGIDLRLEEGRYIAIMGPSGSGKSTLLHILGALERQTAGEIAFEGEIVQRWGLEPGSSAFRLQHVGFIFQAYNLIQHLTVEENVAVPLLLGGVKPKTAQSRAQAMLTRVGLAHRFTHYPTELSGGEQQRVAIARALVHGPRIVLADEPTGNLDSASAQDVLSLLTELHRERQTTIVLITHDPFVAAYAEEVMFLRDGQVVGTWSHHHGLDPVQAGASVSERLREVLGWKG